MGNPLSEIYPQDGGQSSLDNNDNVGQYGGQAQGTGYNPNFQPLLNDLPQDLHEKVLPHLQQWDKGVNERFQQLQSEYAPYKPILSSGVTPEMVQNGLNIMNLLDTNPEGLWRALQDNYKFGQQEPAGQGQLPSQQPVEPDPTDLRFKQMEQNFTTVAEHVLQMRQQEEQARQDAAIANEFNAAHKKIGNFDDTWVQAYCYANPSKSVEEVGRMYQQWHAAEMAKHGARPIITGSSGGGVPGNNVDVTKLSGKDTRNLVADMIRQSRANRD
jgi:hypothetical protein